MQGVSTLLGLLVAGVYGHTLTKLDIQWATPTTNSPNPEQNLRSTQIPPVKATFCSSHLLQLGTRTLRKSPCTALLKLGVHEPSALGLHVLGFNAATGLCYGCKGSRLVLITFNSMPGDALSWDVKTLNKCMGTTSKWELRSLGSSHEACKLATGASLPNTSSVSALSWCTLQPVRPAGLRATSFPASSLHVTFLRHVRDLKLRNSRDVGPGAHVSGLARETGFRSETGLYLQQQRWDKVLCPNYLVSKWGALR